MPPSSDLTQSGMKILEIRQFGLVKRRFLLGFGNLIGGQNYLERREHRRNKHKPPHGAGSQCAGPSIAP